MAVALPIIASFTAAASAVAAAGSLAAAVGTFSGFLSVAGAALTGLGALTGKKDLLKIGGLMSLTGGVTNAMGLGTGAAASGGQMTVEGLRASELAGTGATNAAMEAGGQMAGGAAEAFSGASGMDHALGMGQQGGAAGQQYADAFGQAQTGAEPSLWDRAMQSRDQLGAPSADSTGGSIMEKQVTRAATGPYGVTINGQVMSVDDPIAQAASGMDSSAIDAFNGRLATKAAASVGTGPAMSLDAIGGINKIGAHIRANKEMYGLGGMMLGSMFGSEATALDYQKGIMERRLRNLNNPVAMTTGG